MKLSLMRLVYLTYTITVSSNSSNIFSFYIAGASLYYYNIRLIGTRPFLDSSRMITALTHSSLIIGLPAFCLLRFKSPTNISNSFSSTRELSKAIY